MNKPLTEKQLSRRTFDFNEAARLYESGLSLNEVGRILGKKPELIRVTLKRIGIERRPQGAATGESNHQFKGGTYATPAGYVRRLGSRAKDLEHRCIAERALGRQLAAGEVVHHINCIRSDNRPENLLICTQAYHMALHARMSRDPYWREVARQAKATTNHE